MQLPNSQLHTLLAGAMLHFSSGSAVKIQERLQPYYEMALPKFQNKEYSLCRDCLLSTALMDYTKDGLGDNGYFITTSYWHAYIRDIHGVTCVQVAIPEEVAFIMRLFDSEAYLLHKKSNG